MLRSIPSSYKVANNGTIQCEGTHFKFSITNIGASKLFIGVDDGTKPALEIPPKPDEAPGYTRVVSTDHAQIALGANWKFEFEGGSGTAEVITFAVAFEDGKSIREMVPGKTV